jgi:hypothetical protein
MVWLTHAEVMGCDFSDSKSIVEALRIEGNVASSPKLPTGRRGMFGRARSCTGKGFDFPRIPASAGPAGGGGGRALVACIVLQRRRRWFINQRCIRP